MRVFVDIDGTITERQRGRSWNKDPHRLDVITKVKELFDAGHEIILWSGSTRYAQRVAADLKEDYGIEVVAAIGKPHVIVDNQQGTWSRRLKRRVILPESFVETEY